MKGILLSVLFVSVMTVVFAVAPSSAEAQFLNESEFQAAQAGIPVLQASALGTIGPKGADTTIITGINTAGKVRVNNLANIEALLNIIANGLEILGIAWGGPSMMLGFMHLAAGTKDASRKVLFGGCGVVGGLAVPGTINWLVASARDANLFS